MGKGTRQGAQGGRMGAVEVSPARRRRNAQRRAAEEARWARLAGPVTVRRVDVDQVPDVDPVKITRPATREERQT